MILSPLGRLNPELSSGCIFPHLLPLLCGMVSFVGVAPLLWVPLVIRLEPRHIGRVVNTQFGLMPYDASARLFYGGNHTAREGLPRVNVVLLPEETHTLGCISFIYDNRRFIYNQWQSI